GKLCPIETPEGPNIGLIYSLSIFAQINNYGGLETPYKKIEKGKIKSKIYFLAAEDEHNKYIGPFNLILKKKKYKIMVRKNEKNIFVKKKQINYIDYAHNQILSLTAATIPFIEHNDANRALMGSNMIRQALPLLKLEPPIVCTGIEKEIAYYYRNFINAKTEGTVKYVDAERIIIQYNFNKRTRITSFNNKNDIYKISKFKRTNQNICYNLKPIVKKGQKVKRNQILCEGFGTKNGQLALGKNLLVAYMSWKGYNFEDSIIVSKKILKEDTFTSLHIETFTINIKKIKDNTEEVTRNLPNVTSSEIENLDKNGIIKVGSKVKPGDILIGKIKKIENKKNIRNFNITPEEKFLKTIFGNNFKDIKNVSLKAPSYLYGQVIDVKVFEKKKKKLKIKK
ncbi:MAG: DNA-directed RNA polymerase subunit beta, partial [Candidatus Shikimatogenerans sp. JK-2022]|nr:DNA-directed RNA polymerase subunit beta [Candidatus Shikimatogenerans bostrichidophilus]